MDRRFTGHTLQLRVPDIEAECRQLREKLHVTCAEINRFPGLVAFCNVEDPWGNCLGFYRDLSDGEPVLPGGRESEQSQPGG